VAKVCDAITQMSEKLEGLTDVFSPCAKENTPGDCLMDKYLSRIQFDGFDPKEEGAYAKHWSHLDAVFAEAKNSPGTVCCGTDCSVPMHTMHQASAAYVIKQSGNQPLISGWVAGSILPLDAELFAIRSAVVQATMLNNCDHIIVFMDSLTSARRAVDPSVHSGQAHSLAVCRALNKWLAALTTTLSSSRPHPNLNGAYTMKHTFMLAGSPLFLRAGGQQLLWTVCVNKLRSVKSDH
jgi:hypothetical protein